MINRIVRLVTSRWHLLSVAMLASISIGCTQSPTTLKGQSKPKTVSIPSCDDFRKQIEQSKSHKRVWKMNGCKSVIHLPSNVECRLSNEFSELNQIHIYPASDRIAHGHNVSCQFRLLPKTVDTFESGWLTLYLTDYSAARQAKSFAFDQAERAIETRFRGLKPRPTASVSVDSGLSSRAASWEFEHDGQSQVTSLWLGFQGDWGVKIRATYALHNTEEGSAQDSMLALYWLAKATEAKRSPQNSNN